MIIHSLDKKMNMSSVLVEYRDRPSGSTSKLNTYSDGLRVLLTILSMVVEYKPLLFFSILTVLFAGVGVILFIQILVEFSLTCSANTCVICCIWPNDDGANVFLYRTYNEHNQKKHRELFEINLNLLCKK